MKVGVVRGKTNGLSYTYGNKTKFVRSKERREVDSAHDLSWLQNF